MTQWPGILGGKHKLVAWLNKIRAGAKASELKQVIGEGRLIENTDGKILVITAGRAKGGGGTFAYGGTWDAAKAYAQGTIVRKKLGTMQGVYIAKEAATPGQEPTYPETAPWDLLCFGVIEYLETADDLDGVLRTIYVNASDRL